MDRDDAGMSDREEQARQGDTGMIGSEAEEPGPGRDTSLTEPDPVAAGTDQPRSTVAMSEGDPMRTRLGSHVEGAGVIGYDVAGSEEGATQQTPPGDRPGYEPERDPTAVSATTPGASAETWADDAGPADRSFFSEDPGVTEPSAFTTEDTGALDPSAASPAGYEGEPGGAGMVDVVEEGDPTGETPTTYVQDPPADQGVYDQDADDDPTRPRRDSL